MQNVELNPPSRVAIPKVQEFEKVVRKLEQQVTLRGQSKYKKDRIVPLDESMAVGLKKYLKVENPHTWLFNGKEPDGRYSVSGLSWVMYLYPVHQLSSAFKGKFLDSLKRALCKKNEVSLFYDKIQQAYKTKWVVHYEPSLAGAEHVIKYLGQYTHRVAITNQRILDIDEIKITFIA